MDNDFVIGEVQILDLTRSRYNVKINYKEHYFICPKCGTHIVFRKYNERYKKYSVADSNCPNCKTKYTAPLLCSSN